MASSIEMAAARSGQKPLKRPYVDGLLRTLENTPAWRMTARFRVHRAVIVFEGWLTDC
jgi:hypothetical protein